MSDLKMRVEKELRSNILPFWLKYTIDDEFGGFRGQITNDLVIDPKADKGLILNTRILWTFSKAYSVYRADVYLRTATRAYDYILQHFWDNEFGGVYWMLNYRGEPCDTKKRVYGQAFTVYALAEYYLATRDDEALKRAIALHEVIEKTSHDSKLGGYFETYERDWSLAQDQRLSAVDMDEKKSMNTHLHMLEAYANLCRAWDDEGCCKRLRELIEIFLNHIIHPKSHHFLLFFDEDWTPKSDVISFGHDIEGSWLLCEAAEIYGDPQLLKRVREEAVRMAQAVHDEAVDSDGGLMYEAERGKVIDSDKHWWPQAEAVVGLLNAYKLSGKEDFRLAAERSWDFIEKHIVDHQHGEWFGKVSRNGVPSDDKYKVDPWKCPYHNSRTCFEVMARLAVQAPAAAHP
ncbi:MAG TPA: AGE family epimerase/isomerase [Terriglobales bacterium]|nr:AGE family epimerase/isomerase [Terriglobales bacterium]